MVEWRSDSVDLIKPSLGQCQEVISKLKEKSYHCINLSNSSSCIVHFLLPELLKVRTTEYISISSTKVTKDSIISSQLSNNTTLKKLLITGGSINDDGVIALVKSLKYNNTITTLHLSNNPDITSAIAHLLAELLCNNYTLKYLYLYNTSIGIDGVRILVEALKTNRTLMRLRLSKQHEKTCYSLPYFHTIQGRLCFE